MERRFNTELFIPWYIFYFKFNRHIVLRNTSEWLYILDLDFDPEFWPDTEVLYISWSSLSEEFIDNKAFWNYG